MRVGIIGGGPAGYSAGIICGKKGYKTTVFEMEDIGGVCLNRGCIPTKSLIHSARNGISFQEAVRKKEMAKKRLVMGIERLLKNANVKVIRKRAVFDGRVVNAEGEIMEFDRIIIATGSIPSLPPIEGIENAKGSRTALSLEELPSKLLIIGGGVIGLEFAYIFSSFGSNVEVVEIMEEILPGMDRECASLLRREMEKRGIRFHLKCRIEKIEKQNSRYRIKGDIDWEGDDIFVFTGRKPNTQGLPEGLLDENGVKVNEYMETPIKNVFAAGDCTGKYLLAHYAYHTAEVACENLIDKKIKVSRNIPFVVFTQPEFASCGRMEGRSVSVPFSSNGRAVAEEKTQGIAKLFYEEGIINGITIVGGDASEMIISASLLIGKKIEDARWIIPPHPTYSEIFKEVINAAYGCSIHT